MHELPLVFFTVIAQGVSGAFILLTLLFLSRPQYCQEFAAKHTKSVICLWPLLGISGLFAMSHMGLPIRAFNIVYGLEHASPLSIEIVTVSVFGGLGVLATGLLWKGQQFTLTRLSFIAGSLSAFGLVWAIGNVYQLPSIPMWDSGWTKTQFFITALNLGSALLFCFVQFNRTDNNLYSVYSQHLARVVCGIALVVSVSTSLAYTTWLNSIMSALGAAPSDQMVYFSVFRLGLISLAFVVASALNFDKSRKIIGLAVVLAVFMAELLGRAYFYDLMTLNHL